MSKNKRDVALLARDIDTPGGTERVIADHSQNLDADIWCTYYDSSVYPELFQKSNINYYGESFYFPILERTFNFLYYVLLTDLSFLEEYDAVVAESPFAHILAYRAGKKYGIRTIWSCQHPDKGLFSKELDRREGDGNLIGRAINSLVAYIVKPLDIEAFRGLDFVFVNSWNTLKNQLRPAYGEECEHVEVTYTPVEIFPKVENFGEYYLSISRVNPDKQFENAIDALSRIEGDKPLLKIAGSIEDQNYKDNLLTRASEKGVDVEFLGYVSEDRLFELIEGCRFGIFTPEYEDFGLVPAEFVSTGKVCFAPSTAGVAEIIPDKYCYSSIGELVTLLEESDPLDYSLRDEIKALNERYYDRLRKAINE